MTDIVEQVKEANRIEDVIEESGFGLRQKYGRYMHGAGQDWSSLVVDTAKQVYHWNSRKEWGDVISWLMARRNLDFKTAVEELARRAKLPDPKWSREDQAVRAAARIREVAFEVAARVFQKLLLDDPEALEYCRGRGWTDETIREAGLGFTGKDIANTAKEIRGEFSLYELDPESSDAVAILGFRGDVRTWAQKHDIDLKGNGLEHWVEWGFIPGLIGKMRLVYPHYVFGRVKTFSGRNILGAEINKDGRTVKSYNLPAVLTGGRLPFYNQVYTSKADELVIVEGQADAVTLGQWGIPAMALIGTAHQDQTGALEELKKRHNRLYWGMDGDEAGKIALMGRKKDWPMIEILGPMTRVVRWPECEGDEGPDGIRPKGKDANDWLKWGLGALGLTEYSVDVSDDLGSDNEQEDSAEDRPYEEHFEPQLPAAEVVTLEDGETDELLDQAKIAVRREGQVSQAFLMRQLKIGHTRAAKLLLMLERQGFVGAADVNGMRLLLDKGRAVIAGETGEARIKRLLAEQEKRARDLLNSSLTMVEEMATWAGGQKGADRDEALRTVFRAVIKMDRVDRANYRGRLADLMQIGLRDFDSILKAAGADQEDRPINTVETLGGYFDGWLLEYVYDPAQQKARLAYRDPDRKMGVADFVDINGVRYVPRYVTQFIQDGGVLFASDLGGKKSTKEMVAIVEAFIHQNYLLESRYLGRIIAYYVLLTWVYDAFNALPYLRAIGEAGAGKSELIRRVGHLCYRMMAASGASTAASFFRATETYRGTVMIDEADLADGGDMANDLVKFLNLGAMKGNSIWRMIEINTDVGRAYEVATFTTYCPKLIAMRKDFRDDAVGSRCLTIKIMPREPIELKAKNIKLYIDDAFRERARAIRNLLLRWRFETWAPEIEVTEDHMDMDISSRLNQVTMPLKALANNDKDLQEEIEKFLRAYNQEMVLSRSMTIAARVVEAMWRIWSEADLRSKYLHEAVENEGFYILIGDVTKVANTIIDEMNADSEEGDDEEESTKKKRKRESLTSRGVGALIRNELQLQVGNRRGIGYPVFWDSIKLQGLAKRFGVRVFDPETPGGNGVSGQAAPAENHPELKAKQGPIQKGLEI